MLLGALSYEDRYVRSLIQAADTAGSSTYQLCSNDDELRFVVATSRDLQFDLTYVSAATGLFVGGMLRAGSTSQLPRVLSLMKDASMGRAAAAYHAATILGEQFLAFYVDIERDTALLLNDVVGAIPLYYRAEPNRLSFSTDSSLLTRLSPGSLDLRGLVEYCSFEHFLGDRTLIEEIKVLQPANCVRFVGGEAVRVCYTQPPHLRLEGRARRSLTPLRHELDEALTASIAERVEGSRTVGVSLTGGLDSRLVAGYAAEAVPDARAFFVGPRGCWDNAFGSRVARALRIPYQVLTAPESPARNLVDEYIDSTNPEVSIRHAHFVEHRQDIRERFPTVLSGAYGGELFGQRSRAISVPARSPRIDQLRQALRGFYSRSGVHDMPQQFFEPSIAEQYLDLLDDSLSSALAGFPDGSIFAQIDHFIYSHHLTRFIRSGSPGSFGSPPRFSPPFLSERVIAVAVALPREQRLHEIFYRGFLQWRFPRLARIPWQFTGFSPSVMGRIRHKGWWRRTARPGALALARRWPEVCRWVREQAPHTPIFDLINERFVTSTFANGAGQPDNIGPASVFVSLLAFLVRARVHGSSRT